jgi:hypothetical protein
MKMRLKRGGRSKAMLRSKDLGHLHETTKENVSGSSTYYAHSRLYSSNAICRVPVAECQCCRVSKLHAECHDARKVLVAECPCYSSAECPSCIQSTFFRVPCCTQSAYCIVFIARAAECPSCMQSACCTVPLLYSEYLLQSAMLHAHS